MRVEKEDVAEPGKQKDWTPEASQSQDCLEAVNTKPHLYPTFPALLLSGRSEAALEAGPGAAAGGGGLPWGLRLTSLTPAQEGQDRGPSSDSII